MDLSWLKSRHQFRTLIDIGANNGDFGAYLASTFGIERVIAIEPLPIHAPGLRAKGFTVHSVALGDEDREITFHENTYDGASSPLPLTERCIAEYPQVAQWRDIVVPQRRLDGMLSELEPEILIKVDAQGAEASILRGGHETFRSASVILIEMTLLPLYDGQELFNALHGRLDDLGFSFVGFRAQHVAKSGEPLFLHGIYEKAA
jgi:FkbM family methyltransferase